MKPYVLRLPGVGWWRTQQGRGATLPVCPARSPFFSSSHHNPSPPTLHPQAPPRCGLVAHSAGKRRHSACLPRGPPSSLPLATTPLPLHFPRRRLPELVNWRTQQGRGAPLPVCPARSPFFSSSHPNPTPLPLHFPRRRLSGVGWWRTQQGRGATLPVCPAVPFLLFLSPQPLSPHTCPAGASQVWAGGALSREEARLCLSAPRSPFFSSSRPNPSPPTLAPQAPLRCGLVAHSAGKRRASACLPRGPPSSLPITPTPLPPLFHRSHRYCPCGLSSVAASPFGAPHLLCPSTPPHLTFNHSTTPGAAHWREGGAIGVPAAKSVTLQPSAT
ncbi:unnamed protein product [Closterium sp. NIES-65]|nr:unnamed protein product [Closterium sp. NIES-65]